VVEVDFLSTTVMAGLDPAIHLTEAQDLEMDGRLKGGHDR
jgi:hypothetical protein